MTTVTFYRDEENKYYGFNACKHAGFARAGKDIVCAAISVLLTNLVNSVEEFTDASVESDADPKLGYMGMTLKNYDSEKVQLLFESAMLGLSGVMEEYPKHLKLTNRRCKP